MPPTVRKRPASGPVRPGAVRPTAATKTEYTWPGPGLLDSQQVVLSQVAKEAGGCSLHQLLQQHVKERPHGAEHRLSKQMLLNSAKSTGDHMTFQEYQESMDLAGGAEDTVFCDHADWMRTTILEKIEANLEPFGLVELEQLHTFMLLLIHHPGRDWAVKLLPTSGFASSSSEADLTPVEDSDEEIEQLRQAYLEASTTARQAKKKARAAMQIAEQKQKVRLTAWKAFINAQTAAQNVAAMTRARAAKKRVRTS